MDYYQRRKFNNLSCILWSLYKRGDGVYATCLNELGLNSCSYPKSSYISFEGDRIKNRVIENTRIKRWEI